MNRRGLGGSAIGALGTLLLVIAFCITAYQFREEGPDLVGIIIAVACWLLGACCYLIRWRN